MRQFDDKQHAKTRNPDRPGDAAGLALPARVRGTLFQGWGPKLMLAAIAVSALCTPAMAQQVSFVPESATGVSQGELSASAAIQDAYDYADSVIQGGCPSGTVQNEARLSENYGLNAGGWWARVSLTATCVVVN
jgi:hypothetical protein